VEHELRVDGVRLAVHLARPATTRAGAAPGLVLCPGFPGGPPGPVGATSTYPQLADRIAAESGFLTLALTFRGTGESGGDFSLSGWTADLRAAIDHLVDEHGVLGVWVAGSSAGGAVAICEAADDDRVRGVATLAAPADFDQWSSDPRSFLEHCRRIGAVRSPSFPPDMGAWSRELRDMKPLLAMGKLAPRAVLVLHGSDDDVVPVADARALADSAGEYADLRILPGAGHRLRHDPRAVAVLLGWLIRQAG
jgi:uncharacterized protein